MNTQNSNSQNQFHCPQCGGPTLPEYDKQFRQTGKRICLTFTCPQKAYYHIPTAQEIDAAARVHEADMDRDSQ